MKLPVFDEIVGFDRQRCDKWFAVSLALFTLAHLLILFTNPLDLSSDETLYWAYSKHPDWSYYAKGPGIGVATWIGSHLFGDTMFGVRSVALVCFTIFSSMLYVFLRRAQSPAAGLYIFLLVHATTMFVVTGFVTTTDPLVLPFWLGSLIFAHNAIKDDSPRAWIPSFVLAGLGVLAKYTAVLLLPGYGLVLLCSPSRRRHLWSGGFLLACVAFVISISPILIWNASHDWVNIGHNVGHTVGSKKSIPFKHFPELLGSQLGLIGPVIFPLCIILTFRAALRWLKTRDDIQGLYVMSVLPLLAVSVLVTLTRQCYPNWPMPAYVGALLILAAEFRPGANLSWLRRGLFSNAAICLVLQASWYLPWFYPAAHSLPTPIRRMSGWSHIAERLRQTAQALEKSGRTNGRPFVLAFDYMTEASMRFYLPAELEVRLGSFTGRRLSEEDFWQSWDELKGRDAIVIGSDDQLPTAEQSKKFFQQCEPLSIEGIPPKQRTAKPFGFLLCKGYTGAAPEISRAF